MSRHRAFLCVRRETRANSAPQRSRDEVRSWRNAMILGLSTTAFTLVHVGLSLIGMLAGAIVAYGMCKNQQWRGWTALFLATTAATTVTGFLFHSAKFGAAHAVGVVSLVVLVLAILALYANRLAGPWRWLYVVAALAAFYLNVFV